MLRRIALKQKRLFSTNTNTDYALFDADTPEGMRHIVNLKLKRKRMEFIKSQFGHLGSSQTRDNTFQPHHTLHRPPSSSSLTLSSLMSAGAHFGHSTSLLNPAFTPYVYGTRAGITIINLDTTLPLLRRAAALIRAVALQDGTIIFVGTRPELKPIVKKASERVGENSYYVGERWLPGTLTNRVQIFSPTTAMTTKIIPDLVVFLNPITNLTAIRECAVQHVPTIGIIDSNADPRIVMYPIPANDESLATAEIIAGVLSISAREGVQTRAAELEKRRKEAEAEEKRAREVKFDLL
ncbi:hypothetical protein Clacol_006160 [Clathrus columnatus]|uniref:Ribosomal protein S2 n=1 Tax=Clathrus columnatus TaxID=1419009 RepID=A0AAV5AE56_9AGAM|nr:hypothetical protein Clacol_006160 [Clathrus columnatus]